jgi:hypothetical protein
MSNKLVGRRKKYVMRTTRRINWKEKGNTQKQTTPVRIIGTRAKIRRGDIVSRMPSSGMWCCVDLV